MKNLLKVFGVIAFVAVIGFSFAACGNGTTSGSGGGNSGLNGTWVSVSGDEEITLSGSSFTLYSYGIPSARGTYSTSGNNISVTITAVYDGIGRWYSRADFVNMGVSEAELDYLFTTETSTYSLNGDTLIVDGGTYTRQ